jgi:hypothetical protein
MSSLKFSDLLAIYRNTAFAADGRSGVLTIASPEILATLKSVENHDDIAEQAGIALPADDVEKLAVGDRAEIEISAPRLGLGILAPSFDVLLNAPEARLREPAAYFVIKEGIASDDASPAPIVLAYRRMLGVVALLVDAASYCDRVKGELVFIHDGKFVVPIRYDSLSLAHLSEPIADALTSQFSDPLHRDQRLEILATSVVSLTGAQPAALRFSYLVQNLDELAAKVGDGYRLFASSFSYGKIRSELENAKIDYVTKIHRTVADIQGQLLGIPVATVIVASQLKVATTCGIELWTDVAVILGAWIFAVLLGLAIVNQWLTLAALRTEILRQQTKLASDYAAIGEQFSDIFSSLRSRICWHRIGLMIVGVVALVGAGFANFAFVRLARVDVVSCLSGPLPLSPPAATSSPSPTPHPHIL